MPSSSELRAGALHALAERDPARKCTAVAALLARRGRLTVDPAAAFDEPPGLPGRPDRPRLVAPTDVPLRSVHTPAGRIALLHALAHIEFNAINLALDAIWRFGGLPPAYYTDWLGVAAEEAQHFQLLQQRLAAAGARYGDCDAHDGLWEMARKTAADVLARMALVPRVLEARGLDASPAVIAKLRRAGDEASARVVERILRDEVGHVAIGNRWFHWLCAQRDCDPVAAFAMLADRHGAPRLRPPLNLAARAAAGFSAEELTVLRRSSERA